MAWGTKFAIASVRSPMSGHRVVLGVEHVPHRGGGGEAARFVDLIVELAGRAPGISAFVADGELDFVEVTRHQAKRDRKTDGTWAFYARHTLTCLSSETTHDWWEPLTPTQTDEAHKFNRSDYLRVLPPTDPDYSRV